MSQETSESSVEQSSGVVRKYSNISEYSSENSVEQSYIAENNISNTDGDSSEFSAESAHKKTKIASDISKKPDANTLALPMTLFQSPIGLSSSSAEPSGSCSESKLKKTKTKPDVINNNNEIRPTLPPLPPSPVLPIGHNNVYHDPNNQINIYEEPDDSYSDCDPKLS